MKTSILPAAALFVVLSAIPASAETGDLKIRFEYGGAAPERTPVSVTKDMAYCGQSKLLEESLIVNPENKGVQNVIVHVYTGRGGSKLDKVSPANNTHTLANQKCRFEPHVVIAQVGDTLVVTNPDPIGHNANMNFFNNQAQNKTIPPNGEVKVLLESDEPAAMPVDCNIHPWMKAFVLVLEHPFAAKSDENGVLTIKGLPAGEKLVFRVLHETGSFREVEIEGLDPISRRGTFEVEVKPGLNDLGTIVMPAI